MLIEKPKIREAVDPELCRHPPDRLWSWFARDDREPDGQVLCVACCDCGKALKGGC